MGSRAGKHHGRYDDPYTYDDPYLHASPTSKDAEPAYEYVGTDEPEYSHDPAPPRHTYSPDHEPRRRPSPTRRMSRTTSPPRRSRHHRKHYSPPPRDSPRDSPRGGGKRTDSRRQKYQEKYQDFAQKPAVQRTKTYGRQGLNLIGEAAAAYAAAQAGGREEPRGPRGRSLGREEAYGRYSPEPPEPRRSRHSRRYSPSPSPSPSPPRRHRSSRTDDRGRSDRPRLNDRYKSYSASPPPRSRKPDSEYDLDDRGRERRHRRPKPRSPSITSSPSPPPRSRRRGRSGPSTPSSGFRSTFKNEHAMPGEVAAARWQMAARAALEAGGVTAFRLRKEPGKWTGDKGAKVATAALGAAAIDAFIDKDPRRSKSSGRGMKGMAENAIGSMLASQLMGFKGSTSRVYASELTDPARSFDVDLDTRRGFRATRSRGGTSILTGNLLNVGAASQLLRKSAAAHLVQHLALAAYADEPCKFHFGDERLEDGAGSGLEIDGEADNEAYLELAEDLMQRP
ncbi:Uu.00g006700.m01.CDS01 [Anthostomella pinea]|uniref:Uu.00g006700.m01.CDS01 n=1 Tax=Anthostomella pinea TaxID=933095 RepID=A0AAI8YJ04_9PEZI|nr:Uu.00g006700.m01.CDS01 [Anthostomella pinea]